MIYRIFPPDELIEEGLVSLPPSKSILNRRLIIDALAAPGAPCAEATAASSEATPAAQPRPALSGDRPCTADFPDSPDPAPEAVDVQIMRSCVDAITSSVKGTMELNVGESGTALRLLTALLATRPEGEEYILTGQPGLLHRPMAPLVDALRTLGADIRYLDREGFAPLRIASRPLPGGCVCIDASLSSQFVSALMLVAPGMKQGLRIDFDGEPASLPYIKMTAAMMRHRGSQVDLSPLAVDIKPGQYHPDTEEVEADWSAAAFWYETVALTAGWITLTGDPGTTLLPLDQSVQGDARAAEFFECLGVLTEPSEEHDNALSLSPSPEVYGRLDLDLRDYPDMAPSLAVTCCMLGVPFKFVGLEALAAKETDRLTAIVEEMEKVGCTVERIRDYGLEWEGRRHPITTMPIFDPHGDHRMAMALAPIAAYIPGILLADPDCVAKSYPTFWANLRSLGFTIEEASSPLKSPASPEASESASSEAPSPEG